MTGSTADDLSFLQAFANTLGASEAALRLLLSLLIGYPIVLCHRYLLYCKSPTLQHLYFILTGISVAVFNYGNSVIHSALCILATWLLLVVIGGTLNSVIISFVFHMLYLLVGYYYTATDTYDIKWTMPHCVLTLRLIGLTFDVYDGKKEPEKLSADQQKAALTFNPSLLEIAAHTYFPASFLVGPQFCMKRYLDFVSGKLAGTALPPCIIPGLMRGGLGLILLALYQVFTYFIPDTIFESTEYEELSLWMRYLCVGFWGHFTLFKYISCWLIAEGVCIISGLSYSGKDANSNWQWNGCANVKMRLFAGATSFGNMISSFNINTNAWVAQYVFKRLRFMNSRSISHSAALLFLAVWHGLHSGYYHCFLMEFVVITFERDVTLTLNKYPEFVSLFSAGPLMYVKYVILKLYLFIFMGYCLGSFVLLSFERWWQFYASLYFSGHIFFGLWRLYRPGVVAVLNIIFGKRESVEKIRKE